MYVRVCAILVFVGAFLSPDSAVAREYKMLVNQLGFKKVTPGNPDATIYLAPAGSRFVIDETTNDVFRVRFTSIPTTASNSVAGNRRFLKALSVPMFESGILTPFDTPNSPPIVSVNENFEIEKQILREYNYQLEFGSDWGVLAVPFKLQTDDGSLVAGSSLGTYIGLKQRWLGAPSTMLVSVGLSVVPTQDVNVSAVSNKTGLSAAVGIVFEPARQIQVGLIAGMDHLGGTAGKAYPYEDRPWLSFAIGFGFAK